MVGIQAPMRAGGAAITETVFSWPGMGRLGVEAALGRDYPVVMAVTLAVAPAVVVIHIALDLIYYRGAPRIRLGRAMPRSALLLVLLVLFAWVGPLLRRTDPDALDLGNTVAAASAAHPLGTDES